jgi:hypothetical protein
MAEIFRNSSSKYAAYSILHYLFFGSVFILLVILIISLFVPSIVVLGFGKYTLSAFFTIETTHFRPKDCDFFAIDI